MIQLRFTGMAGSASLGPAPWFRIAGNFVRQGPSGLIVGTFREHHWELQSRHFVRYDCSDTVLIHFEDVAGGPTDDYGPFGEFHAADGVMYAANKLFAKFIEETQLWHCYPTENFWPVMVIKSAAGSLKQAADIGLA